MCGGGGGYSPPPAPEPPPAPPAPMTSPETGNTSAASSQTANDQSKVSANRRGRSSLTIDLAGGTNARTGGLNIPS